MSDSEDEAESESKKRPTLRNLGDSHSMNLTTLASSYFSFMVLTTYPFPEGAIVSEMVLRAWKAASNELRVNFLPPSPNERTLVRMSLLFRAYCQPFSGRSLYRTSTRKSQDPRTRQTYLV